MKEAGFSFAVLICLSGCGEKKSVPMNEESFWSIVEDSKAKSGADPDRQAEVLRASLSRLPAEDILAFDRIWAAQINRAYTWDLWAAAYIIKSGCSDDGFEYFRRWLVGRGRRVFEAALKDPESLVDVADPDSESEDLGTVASEAYEKVTGKEFSYDHRPASPKEPSGESWEEETVDRKYPKLAAKFN